MLRQSVLFLDRENDDSSRKLFITSMYKDRESINI